MTITSNGEKRVQNILKQMGNREFNLQAYVESESYQGICKNMECMLSYGDEGSEGVLAYWWEKGLKKELHDTETQKAKWASYLPVSWTEGITPKKRYPLLFVMHGNKNTIYLAETYGYTHIAAREEMIVIIPEDESAKNICRLWDYAKENYPVDWSRVYMVGYSRGGWMTSRHALRWPERFAAIGVGGMLFANGFTDTPWPGKQITEEMFAHAREMKMPICDCMGEQEIIPLLPVTMDMPQNEENQPGMPVVGQALRRELSPENKITSINNWRRIAGCQPVPEEEVRRIATNTADIVTEKLGFPFEQTRVRKIEGRSHYIGDCVNPDGDVLARFVCVAKSGHWPSMALAELTWEFIRRFSRNPETGELKLFSKTL